MAGDLTVTTTILTDVVVHRCCRDFIASALHSQAEVSDGIELAAELDLRVDQHYKLVFVVLIFHLWTFLPVKEGPATMPAHRVRGMLCHYMPVAMSAMSSLASPISGSRESKVAYVSNTESSASESDQ